jgi:hypothetical protein
MQSIATRHQAPTTLSLPQWLRPLLAAHAAAINSGEGIPESKAPTAQQRAMIERRIEELEAARMSTDMPAAMSEVTGLLVSFPMQALSEQAARARSQAYSTALEDLPAWAVSEACRRWIRAEVEGDHNFNFAPSPPVLRIIALEATYPLMAHLVELKKLLKAKTEREFSEEHCAAMRAKLAPVLRMQARQ